MKFIILLFLFINFLEAKYEITYNGLKIGEVKTFESIQKGYLKADVTNSIAKWLLGKDKVVLYTKDSTKTFDKKEYYSKEDKSQLINVLNAIIYKTKNTNKNIVFSTKDNLYYKWIYTNKKNKTRDGYIILKDNELFEFHSNHKDVKVKKI